jgi:cytochrome P450
MSVADVLDFPAAGAPLVPPSPPRASSTMGPFGRMAAMRKSAIGTWGQRAYEEDIIKGRFFGHASFILNAPDAIRHVLVDNYENYTRTPAGIRVLRPMLGEGLLLAEGRAWKHQRRTLAPAFTPRAVNTLVPHMISAIDDTLDELQKARGGPVNLREIMQRMTLEIAGRTMFSFDMGERGPKLRDFVIEYGTAVAAVLADPAGFFPQPVSQAMDPLRCRDDYGAARRRQERGGAATRSVRSDGGGARSGNQCGVFRRPAWRSGGHDDSRWP